MLNSSRLEAEKIFHTFIQKHSRDTHDFTHVPIDETGLTNVLKGKSFGLTQFNDPYDTLLYSRLIQKALELRPDTHTLIDLGAGSSIPTLVALMVSQRYDVSTIAVDVDPNALRVSQLNAQKAGLEERYTYQQGSVIDVLGALPKNEQILIVSNPPFIPVPESLTSYELIPIHGGDDGTKYMLELLEQDYSPGTVLALFWGSLTNPARIIPLIEKKFDVLYVQAAKVHFGDYTSQPAIRTHLHELRDSGRTVFETHPKHGDVQTVIGTIIQARTS